MNWWAKSLSSGYVIRDYCRPENLLADIQNKSDTAECWAIYFGHAIKFYYIKVEDVDWWEM